MFLKHALRLAEKGFHVFPLQDGKKTPRIKGYTDLATTDTAQIERWWQTWPDANIGIATTHFNGGGALLAFDVDNKNGKNGASSFAAFCIDHKLDPPETFTQTTPTGGKHVIFRVPEALRQGAGVLGEGLDTRSGGGYVVGSGSVIDGKAYTDNGAATAFAPAEAVVLFHPWRTGRLLAHPWLSL